MKIRTRFTLLFAVLVGVILSLFSFSIYYLSENHRQHDFYTRLQDRGVTKLKILSVANTDTSIIKAQEYAVQSILDEKFVIYNDHYQLVYQDTNFKIPSVSVLHSIQPDRPYSYSSGGVEYLGFTTMYKGELYYIFASGIDKHGTNYISNLKQTLIFRGLILLFVIFLCGWLYVGYLLQPISKIIQQVGKISYKNMNQRLDNNKPNDEVRQLIATFNKMLDRLELAFNSQKRFVSNASHELRNPLTAINGQIDVALMKDRNKEEYKATLQNISKDIKNLKTLTNNLLELASSGDSLSHHFEDVRVDELIWVIRDEAIRLNPEYKVNIEFESLLDNEDYVTCKGERKLLETAFINLIDNACKFSPDKKVTVKIAFDTSNIILFFIDEGIGFSESYLTDGIEPLHRGENALGIHGNGIGLSLTHRIINIHSGEIVIQSKINEGSTVKVTIPNVFEKIV